MLAQLALFFLLNKGKQNGRIFYAEKVAKKSPKKLLTKNLVTAKFIHVIPV
jgi:hypothetical protein